MSNQKLKVIYSLRLHLQLQELGFVYLTEMKNPHKPAFNWWVYEETDALRKAYDELLTKGGHRRG